MQTALLATAGCAALFNALFVFAERLDTSPYDVPDALNGHLVANDSKYSYPTDITRDIVPKPLHSHNDYWRDIPFWSALSVGAMSVEADVWLYNGTLYVGHEESSLTHQRTFKSLYVDPILSVLKRQNPSSPFVSTPTRNGVFDMDYSQTLYLWTDVKTDGVPTFKAVIRELEPLRAAGYLTHYADGTVTPGPVTVIGTGNTPLSSVQGVSPRDYFWDAPLNLLSSTYSNITAAVTPIASVDFAAVFGTMRTGKFDSEQLATLKKQVATATEKGIGARYWGAPLFPVTARNRVWSTLWEAGVALINVDDLVAGAGFGDMGNFWEVSKSAV